MGHRFRRLISAATFVRLAASILLALVIWGFIVWETNPEITREYQSIAVTPENIPANMLIVGDIPSISVTLKGPQDVVQRIVSSEISASIDFTDIDGPGIDNYPVTVDTPSGVRKLILEPSAIEVEVDLIVNRTFQISLQEDETRPASVTSITPSTEIASIQGPKALVDRVESVTLPVDLQGQRESFTANVALVALDANGQTLEDVEISPSSVELDVTYESTSKDVPVIVECACIVDDRLDEIELTAAAAIPSTVRLSGPSSAIAEILAIETVPVDISGLRQSGWILDVELDTLTLPDTVSISNQTVDVWVPIDPIRVEFPDVPVEILGLGDDLQAELSAESVFVVVSGEGDALNDPETLDVVAVVDLTDLPAGSYNLDVRVVVPAGVSYESVTPESLRVVITRRTTTANRLQETRGFPTEGIR